MDDLNSADYYRARELKARAMAAASTNPAVAKIHLEMASRYAELLNGAAPVLVAVRDGASR